MGTLVEEFKCEMGPWALRLLKSAIERGYAVELAQLVIVAECLHLAALMNPESRELFLKMAGEAINEVANKRPATAQVN